MAAPYYEGFGVTLYHGDYLGVLRELPDESVDSVVTDLLFGLGAASGLSSSGPAYGNWSANPTCATCGGRLRGTTKCGCRTPDWRVKGRPYDPVSRQYLDTAAPLESVHLRQWRALQARCEIWAAECLRVLKPGGHMVAFGGGTRTWHRMVCAIEDAGFEIRDSIAWLSSAGLPRSVNVAKAIAKATDSEHEVLGAAVPVNGAAKWQGFGTSLMPSHEPVVLARKPVSGTITDNVLRHGTGALNIDATRVADPVAREGGRWPTNVVLDQASAVALDTRQRTASEPEEGEGVSRFFKVVKRVDDLEVRAFYSAKVGSAERPKGVVPVAKPLDLVRWLVRLVTPPRGVVLETFAGQGTTVEASLIEGFQCIAIEGDGAYLPLIQMRVARQRDPVALVKLTKTEDSEPTLFDDL